MIPPDARLMLSDLLGAPVHEGERAIGHVVDVRFVVEESAGASLGRARMLGLLVGTHRHVGFLGYERDDMRAPVPLAWLLKRRRAECHLVEMADVESFTGGVVRVREGHRRWSPVLADEATAG